MSKRGETVNGMEAAQRERDRGGGRGRGHTEDGGCLGDGEREELGDLLVGQRDPGGLWQGLGLGRRGAGGHPRGGDLRREAANRIDEADEAVRRRKRRRRGSTARIRQCAGSLDSIALVVYLAGGY